MGWDLKYKVSAQRKPTMKYSKKIVLNYNSFYSAMNKIYLFHI